MSTGYTQRKEPRPSFNPVFKEKNSSKWLPLFEDLRENEPNQWVELDLPMKQTEAQYIHKTARKMVREGLFRKIDVVLRTKEVLDAKWPNGKHRRTYSVYVRVASDKKVKR